MDVHFDEVLRQVPRRNGQHVVHDEYGVAQPGEVLRIGLVASLTVQVLLPLLSGKCDVHARVATSATNTSTTCGAVAQCQRARKKHTFKMVRTVATALGNSLCILLKPADVNHTHAHINHDQHGQQRRRHALDCDDSPDCTNRALHDFMCR